MSVARITASRTALEMSEQDLSRFLHKVNQLQQLVQSLEADARRRDAMAACTNHNEAISNCFLAWVLHVCLCVCVTCIFTVKLPHSFRASQIRRGCNCVRKVKSRLGTRHATNARSTHALTWSGSSDQKQSRSICCDIVERVHTIGEGVACVVGQDRARSC